MPSKKMPTTGSSAKRVPSRIRATRRVRSSARLLQLGTGFMGPRALLSAVEMGLFSLLAKGPLNEAQLRERLGLHQRSARDFLDTLVALEVLQRSAGRYRNGVDTNVFLDRAKPTYVGGFLEMAAVRLYLFWGSLTEALRASTC